MKNPDEEPPVQPAAAAPAQRRRLGPSLSRTACAETVSTQLAPLGVCLRSDGKCVAPFGKHPDSELHCTIPEVSRSVFLTPSRDGRARDFPKSCLRCSGLGHALFRGERRACVPRARDRLRRALRPRFAQLPPQVTEASGAQRSVLEL